MMKAGPLVVAVHAALAACALGQGRGEAPLIRPEEKLAVQKQTVEFFDAIRPVSREVAASTVWVWTDTGRGKRPAVFGTVIGDGRKVLTKWSEIAMSRGPIQVVGGDGTTAKATVAGVYQDEDLALLQLEGPRFRPVDFSGGGTPGLGRFMIATSPDDTPVSVGVVAVEARSLREKDQAFLGVRLDPEHGGEGVRVLGVEDASGAQEAGLEEGDVILSIGGREVGSLLEMKTALADHGPGDKLAIRYLRNGTEVGIEAELKEKSGDFPQFPNGRLREMERMGTSLSLVRSGFPSVIQTDMQLERDHCGGPVVDLDGRVVGITIARADRTRSFIIPAAAIIGLLERDPVAPSEARAALSEQREERRELARQQPDRGPRAQPAVPIEPGSADRLRRHIDDMERLMERMRDEMEGIGE
jgi:S1-C subfamily serine protease